MIVSATGTRFLEIPAGGSAIYAYANILKPRPVTRATGPVARDAIAPLCLPMTPMDMRILIGVRRPV